MVMIWLSEKRDVLMSNVLGLLWRKFYF